MTGSKRAAISLLWGEDAYLLREAEIRAPLKAYALAALSGYVL